MRISNSDLMHRAVAVVARVALIASLPAAAAAQGGYGRVGDASCVHDRRQVYFEFQVSRTARFIAPRTVSPRPVSPRPVRATPRSPVTLQFVVDTLGRVDSTSIQVKQARDSTLLRESLRELPAWRFRPAIWNDCAVVRQLLRVGVAR